MKKFRKLMRDPRRYFADSRKPVVRSIGSIFYADLHAAQGRAGGAPKVERAVEPASGSPSTTRAPTKRSLSPTLRNGTEVFRGAGVFVPGSPWRWHQRRATDPRPKAPDAIAVFPSGSTFWDAFVMGLLKESGHEAVLIPVWEHLAPGSGIDDLNYHAQKNPLAAQRIANSVLSWTRRVGAVAVVVPYDSSAVTRAFVIAARAFRLPTLCLLHPDSAVLSTYSQHDTLTIPVADAFAWIPGLAEGPPHFLGDLAQPQFAVAVKNAEIAPLLRGQDAAFDDGFALEPFGISDNDDVALLVCPQSNYGLTDQQVMQAIERSVAQIAAEAGERLQLVAVLSGAKGGYLSDAAKTSLAAIRRKTVLLHGDDIPYAAFARRARVAVAISPFDTAVLGSLGCRPPMANLCPMPIAAGTLDTRNTTAISGGPQMVVAETPLREIIATLLADEGRSELSRLLAFVDRLGRARPAIDVVAVPDPLENAVSAGTQQHLTTLLGARRRVYGATDDLNALHAELFVQWGAEPNEAKSRPEILRTAFGRPKLFLEDGFVRSIGLWTDPNEPTLSVVMDPCGVYYDATRASLLERLLNSDLVLTPDEAVRSRRLIDTIVRNRISKYNYAPDLDLSLGASSRRKILLVDQKAGDMSIKYGLASRASFDAMLKHALAQPGEVDIIIKQHPCAITGGSDQAHYTREHLGSVASRENVHLIAFDVNPYALISAVDEVWVVASGMGFEALMAGKKVRCFGAPFYSGWGLTDDHVSVARRQKRRSLEEIFHAFYVRLSRYVDPRTGAVCELETLIDYICEAKGHQSRREAA